MSRDGMSSLRAEKRTPLECSESTAPSPTDTIPVIALSISSGGIHWNHWLVSRFCTDSPAGVAYQSATSSTTKPLTSAVSSPVRFTPSWLSPAKGAISISTTEASGAMVVRFSLRLSTSTPLSRPSPAVLWTARENSSGIVATSRPASIPSRAASNEELTRGRTLCSASKASSSPPVADMAMRLISPMRCRNSCATASSVKMAVSPP